MDYGHPAVRDLAWVIGSPPLYAHRDEGLRCASAAGCAAELAAFARELERLDRDPTPLLCALGNPPNPRLGIYFESLVAFWLERSERYDLLAHNLPIRDCKRTLGELDFVVRDGETGLVSHWEVAVKYYLQTGAVDDLEAWVGPNRQDSLGRKARHLVEQQLPRARLPQAERALADRGLRIDQSFLFVKGWLFYAQTVALGCDGSIQQEQSPVPGGLASGHLRGSWCRAEVFGGQLGRGSLAWRVLNKPNWLVEQRDSEQTPAAPLPMGKNECLGERPQLAVGMRAQQEVERFFVVPNDW